MEAKGEKAKNEDLEAEQLLFMEFVECRERARKELFVSLEKQRLKLLLKCGKAFPKLQEKYDEIQSLQEQIAVAENKKDSNFVWITISPRPDVIFTKFQEIVSRIVKKKWMTNYIYVYEQRGEDLENIGVKPHLHMLLQRNGKKFSEVKREILSVIDKIVDLGVYSAYDVRLVKENDENVMRIMNYILGAKKDEAKHGKQTIDDLWRKRDNILPYYSLGMDDYIKNYFLNYKVENG